MIRLIGYGNPGRGDDGLGPAFAALMTDVPDLAVSTDYQLTVDHALLIADAEMVVFADALIRSDKPFMFDAVIPSTAADVTSHSLGPATVLALSQTLFGVAPSAFVLGITGYEFGEVKEGLSRQARENLGAARVFFDRWLAQSARECADA